MSLIPHLFGVLLHKRIGMRIKVLPYVDIPGEAGWKMAPVIRKELAQKSHACIKEAIEKKKTIRGENG